MEEKTVKEQLHSFPEDLKGAMQWDPGSFDCDSILLCGMGGSAISGAIAADLYMESSRIPLVIVKNFRIPAWANERTLAIISSYSGNTLETLRMYEAARRAGCQMVAITAGGKLEGMCKRDGVKVRLLPSNMQPRHSIGFMIGYTMAILERCGCVCASRDMPKVIDSLMAYRDFMESEEGQSKVDRMVDRLEDRVPVVVTSGFMSSVASRWKNQINENSKMVAFCGQFSEANFDQIDSWASGGALPFVLITGNLPGRKCDGRIRLRMARSDPVERAFHMIMLGDYASMRIAERRGIDPESVAPIKSLKRKLAEMPDFTKRRRQSPPEHPVDLRGGGHGAVQEPQHRAETPAEPHMVHADEPEHPGELQRLPDVLPEVVPDHVPPALHAALRVGADGVLPHVLQTDGPVDDVHAADAAQPYPEVPLLVRPEPGVEALDSDLNIPITRVDLRARMYVDPFG